MTGAVAFCQQRKTRTNHLGRAAQATQLEDASTALLHPLPTRRCTQDHVGMGKLGGRGAGTPTHVPRISCLLRFDA